MGFKGAMDIDFPTEVGPTEETVDALMEYLVGPLLPLKHTDFTKETPSESKQKSVAKQVHAAVVLYNYYHRNHHQESQFLKFDQFCKLATMLKPGIIHHMKYTCQSDNTMLDDPENQLSITEKAIMDACTISETLQNASPNISNIIKEWKVTKVAVLLIDSKKENCFLQFNNGVWSVIEKEVYPENKKRKKIMVEYDKEDLQKLAFLAVKEVAGIVYHELKVLESHVVYSLSQAKTATRFYILQSSQKINEDNLVPIQDVISSLQGPVVKKCLSSWVITPVVEYYYLLPYAEILSKLFSRESISLPHQIKDGSADVSIDQGSQKSCEKESGGSKNVSGSLQKKSKLDSEVVHNSNSSKEKSHDSKDSNSTLKSDHGSKNERGQSKEVSNNLQKKSNLDSELVHISNSVKEESSDSKDNKSTYKSNQCREKDSGESTEVSDNLCKKSKLDSEFVNISNSVKEEPCDSKDSTSTYEYNQCEKDSGQSNEVSDNSRKKSKLDSEFVHISNSVKEEPRDSKSTYKSNQFCEKENDQSKEVSDNLQKTSKLDSETVDVSNLNKEEPQDGKASKNAYKFNQSGEKDSGESKKVSEILQKTSKLDSETVHVSDSNKEEPHDGKASKNTYNSNQSSAKESCESEKVSDILQKKSKLESEIAHIGSSSKEESHDSKVSKHGSESVGQVADNAITSQFTARPVDQKVKESENSNGNSITVSNGNGMKQEDINGSCRAELNDSSSGASNKLENDKLLVCFEKENQNTKVQAPLKVYRHVKRSTPRKSTNSKVANTKDLTKMSTISQSSDERVNGEKRSCMVLPNEDRSLTVNCILDDFHSTVDAKRSELSDAALRALLNKRQKLYDQQRVTESELILCDKKIQAIMHGGIGDCLGLKLEAVIDCCNEICKQDDMQTQQHTNLLVSRSVPILSGKSLSEAQLTLRKACQELDDICLSNNWMLPTYLTSRSDGGFVANVTVKGANFECSGVSGNQPSIHEARNSAASHVIMRLQQMANGAKTATLV